VVTYGRIGTKPRETRTPCEDPEAARVAAERLVTEKLSKGYQEGRIADLPRYEKPDWTQKSTSETVFWEVISLFNWDKTGDDDAVLRPAVKALASMTVPDIEQFADLLAERLHALDTREHARFAYLGEADPDDGDDYISADDFLYVRCVVVANGREFYQRALSDPSLMPRQLEFESLLSLADMAYEEKTGEEFDHASPVDYESFANQAGWARGPGTKGGRFTAESVPPGNRRPS
jgi:hypothetical protein